MHGTLSSYIAQVNNKPCLKTAQRFSPMWHTCCVYVLTRAVAVMIFYQTVIVMKKTAGFIVIDRSFTCSISRPPHIQSGGGNTVHLVTVSASTAPGPPQESLVRDGTKTSLLAKPSPNPDNAAPIVRRPMGLPVAAGCDRAWTQTQNL